MKIIFLIIGLLVLVPTQAMGAEEELWPDLSKIKSTSGKAATEKDIKNGAAVFLLQSDEGEPIGRPINIVIPQFAIYMDKETGKKSKVVIIQAEVEIINGKKAVGAFYIKSGEYLVGLYDEFKLLGTSIPND